MSTSHIQTPTIIRAGVLPTWVFRDETLSKQNFYSSLTRNLLGLLRALLLRKKYLIISFFLKKGITGLFFEVFYFRLSKRVVKKRRRRRGWKARRVFRRRLRRRLKLKSKRRHSKKTFLVSLKKRNLLSSFALNKFSLPFVGFASISSYFRKSVKKNSVFRARPSFADSSFFTKRLNTLQLLQSIRHLRRKVVARSKKRLYKPSLKFLQTRLFNLSLTLQHNKNLSYLAQNFLYNWSSFRRTAFLRYVQRNTFSLKRLKNKNSMYFFGLFFKSLSSHTTFLSKKWNYSRTFFKSSWICIKKLHYLSRATKKHFKKRQNFRRLHVKKLGGGSKWIRARFTRKSRNNIFKKFINIAQKKKKAKYLKLLWIRNRILLNFRALPSKERHLFRNVFNALDTRDYYTLSKALLVLSDDALHQLKLFMQKIFNRCLTFGNMINSAARTFTTREVQLLSIALGVFKFKFKKLKKKFKKKKRRSLLIRLRRKKRYKSLRSRMRRRLRLLKNIRNFIKFSANRSLWRRLFSKKKVIYLFKPRFLFRSRYKFRYRFKSKFRYRSKFKFRGRSKSKRLRPFYKKKRYFSFKAKLPIKKLSRFTRALRKSKKVFKIKRFSPSVSTLLQKLSFFLQKKSWSALVKAPGLYTKRRKLRLRVKFTKKVRQAFLRKKHSRRVFHRSLNRVRGFRRPGFKKVNALAGVNQPTSILADQKLLKFYKSLRYYRQKFIKKVLFRNRHLKKFQVTRIANKNNVGIYTASNKAHRLINVLRPSINLSAQHVYKLNPDIWVAWKHSFFYNTLQPKIVKSSLISAVSSAISSSLQARPALRPLFSLRRLIKRYWRLVFRERSTLLYKLKVKRPLIFANLRPMLEKKLNIRFEVFRFKNIFSITFLTKQDLITFARNKGVLGVSRSSNKLLRRIFKAYVDVRYRKFRYLRFFADIIPIFYLSIILHNLAPLGQILQKGLMANQRSHHKFFKFISALVRIEKSYLSLFCVGFSLQFVGRIQGKRRSTLKSSKFGTLPLQSLSRRVFYYYIPCTVKYGSIGIRLWLYVAPNQQLKIRS